MALPAAGASLALLWIVATIESGFISYLAGYLVLSAMLNVLRGSASLHLWGVLLSPVTLVLVVVLLSGVVLDPRMRSPLGADVRWARITVWVIFASALASLIAAPALPGVTPGGRIAAVIDGVAVPGALFLALIRARPSARERILLAKGIVIAALASVVVGLLSGSLGLSQPSVVAVNDDPLSRVNSARLLATFTYSNPDSFGLVAALAIPLALTLFLRSRGPGSRAIWGAALLATTAAGAYTLTRGLFLAVPVSILVLFACSRRARRGLIGILVIGAAVLAFSSIGSSIGARFEGQQLSGPDASSVSLRYTAVGVTLSELVRYPLGIGGGGVAYPALWLRAGFPAPALLHPHNLFLSVAIEFGTAAGIAFLYLTGRTLLKGLKRTRNSLDPIDAGLLAAAVSYLVAAITTGAELSHVAGGLPISTPTLYLMVCLACIVAPAREWAHRPSVEVEAPFRPAHVPGAEPH